VSSCPRLTHKNLKYFFSFLTSHYAKPILTTKRMGFIHLEGRRQIGPKLTEFSPVIPALAIFGEAKSTAGYPPGWLYSTDK
jgi:hypothetical protein